MEYMTKGHMLADVVAIIGSFIFLYIVLVIPLVPDVH